METNSEESHDFKYPRVEPQELDLEKIVSETKSKQSKEYNPSSLRVLYESGKDCVRTIKDSAAKTGGALYEGGGVGSYFLRGVFAPFNLPTAIRRYFTTDRKWFDDVDKGFPWAIGAMISSITIFLDCAAAIPLTNLAQSEYFSKNIKPTLETHPEILAIPLATTALSLLYEGARAGVKKYQNKKQELIQQYKNTQESKSI